LSQSSDEYSIEIQQRLIDNIKRCIKIAVARGTIDSAEDVPHDLFRHLSQKERKLKRGEVVAFRTTALAQWAVELDVYERVFSLEDPPL